MHFDRNVTSSLLQRQETAPPQRHYSGVYIYYDVYFIASQPIIFLDPRLHLTLWPSNKHCSESVAAVAAAVAAAEAAAAAEIN